MTWKITGAPGTGDDLLYSQAGTPTLDLRFASSKSLVDNVSGQNLVDFTRGGNGVGTYVGSDGLIKNSVVNLLTYSEEFDNAVWAASSGVSVTANQIEAPNGTLTADLVAFDAADRTFRQEVVGVSGVTYTASFYVKGTAGETLRVGGVGLTGVVSNRTLTGGWDRFTFTGVSNQTTIGLLLSTFGGATARNIYLWGAQLEASSTVGEYVKTTSSISGAPRFDHDPETGESLGLLVEEERTNLLLQSEDFSTTWALTGIEAFGSGSTINATTSPNGTLTADLITESTATSFHSVGQSYTYTSGVTYTWSVFVKASPGLTRNFKVILTTTAFAGNPFILINPSDGSKISAGNVLSSSVTPYPDGWYRVSLTATADASGTDNLLLRLVDGTNDYYLGTGQGIYIWGAQLEVGAFPTSYIPTTTAAVTRSADVASITGTNFSSWYNQSESSLYASALAPNGPTILRRVAFATDGTVNNRLGISFTVGNNPEQLVSSSGSLVVNSSVTSVQATSRVNVAAGFEANNFAISANGSTAVVDSSGNMPVGINQFDIGKLLSGGSLNGTIRRLTFFDRRLPDATLQAITT